jgi:hypothetical protein
LSALFFSDLLIAGRFWVDTTAANRPWEHIIDTPIPNDLYDIMLKEFFAVWHSAQPLAELIHGRPAASNPLVFVSCCRADEAIVRDLERRIQAAGIEPFVFFTDLSSGELWPPIVREKLTSCGVW